MNRYERIALFAMACLAAGFVGGGVPVLRHDWPPVDTNVLSALDSVAGWNPIGLGSPDSYPSSFLIVPARAVTAAIFGPYVAHLAFFIGTDSLIAFGAARFARSIGAAAGPRIAFAVFALFNPWTYTQVVAGHLFMLLAYGATLWLFAELYSERPSSRNLCFLALAIAPQIQFLALDSLAYAFIAVRFALYRPLLVLGFMWLPVIVGITSSRLSLVTIPFTLQWEFSQSIPPSQATLLTGYFTHYDRSIEPAATYAMLTVAAIALLGVVAALVRRRFRAALPALLLAAVPILFASGVQGPLAPEFSWAVAHVVGIALFRELYDVLAFASLGYIFACSLAVNAFRPVAFALCAAAAALPVSWMFGPPARFFVFDASLPKIAIDGEFRERFVLLPALNPLSARSGGSGIDPDLRPRAENATPLNEYLATYPFSSALGSFLDDGSTRGFAKLGARRIYSRPWLRTNAAIVNQLALPLPHWPQRIPPDFTSGPVTPLLGLSAFPQVGTADTDYGAGNILFSDARTVRGPGTPPSWRTFPDVVAVRVDNSFADARKGWVDARLAFVERPAIATAYGGAYTVSPEGVLRVLDAVDALVWVRGRLADSSGRVVSTSTNGFRWIALRPGSDALRCFGECAVAAESNAPPALPLDPPDQPIRPQAYEAWTPWLVVTDVSTDEPASLRFDVAYDPLWIAWQGGAVLAHMRLDGATNGWILPKSGDPLRRIFIVEIGALFVAFSELVATLGTLTVLATFFLPRFSRKPVRPEPLRISGSLRKERRSL